jgi:hypothetical protein
MQLVGAALSPSLISAICDVDLNISARNFATNKLAHYLRPDSYPARAAGSPSNEKGRQLPYSHELA